MSSSEGTVASELSSSFPTVSAHMTAWAPVSIRLGAPQFIVIVPESRRVRVDRRCKPRKMEGTPISEGPAARRAGLEAVLRTEPKGRGSPDAFEKANFPPSLLARRERTRKLARPEQNCDASPTAFHVPGCAFVRAALAYLNVSLLSPT